METLVLKCKEVVNNDRLRIMNELRLKLKSKGNGTGYLSFNAFTNVNETTADIKVVNGNAKIYYKDIDKDTFFENANITTYDCFRVYVYSGEAEISITNYWTAVTNGIFVVAPSVTGDNKPDVYFDFAELNGTDLTQIQLTINTSYVSGDMSIVNGMESLTEIRTKYNDSLYGTIYVDGVLETIYMDSSDSTKNHCKFNIPNNSPLKFFNVKGGEVNGFDIYSILLKNDGGSFKYYNVNSNGGNPCTCSYSNGDTIPTVDISEGWDITNYIGVSSQSMALADVVSFLTLLKDGKNANKITLPSTIRIPGQSGVNTDSSVITLVSDLANLDCTVTVA